jgi:hypothetical protein
VLPVSSNPPLPATDYQTDDDTFFDPVLYRRRTVIEHANAWLDSFKTLLVRYETSIGHWITFHWLAFPVLLFANFREKSIPRPTFSTGSLFQDEKLRTQQTRWHRLLMRCAAHKKAPGQGGLSLPKTQTLFQPYGWKSVFAWLPIRFVAFQARSASREESLRYLREVGKRVG